MEARDGASLMFLLGKLDSTVFSINIFLFSSFSVFSMLNNKLEHCPVLLSAKGTNIQTIVGEEHFLLFIKDTVLTFIIFR